MNCDCELVCFDFLVCHVLRGGWMRSSCARLLETPDDGKDLSKHVGVCNTCCICIHYVHLLVLSL
jgi:hypothetical protein